MASTTQMKLAWKFNSLIGVFTAVLFTVLALVTVWNTGRTQKHQTKDLQEAIRAQQASQEALLRKGLASKGESLARLMAQNAADLILNYDTLSLGGIAEDARKDADVALVVFLDKDGNPLTDMPAGTVLDGAIRQEIRSDTESLGHVVVKMKEDGIVKATAELAEQSKKLQVELDEAASDGNTAIILGTVFVSVAGVIAMGALVWLLFVRMVLRPLKKGVDLAEAIRDGELSHRIDGFSGDEIGTLSRALNVMADGLQAKAALAERIAEGDLTVEVVLASEKDQLGKALQRMAAQLAGLLTEVQVASRQIASGSAQISDASQGLSQGATEQASSLEQISASTNQLSSQTRINADNAGQANHLVTQAKGAAEEGNRQMQGMVAAMAEISEAGRSISRIIKTIDEIAFQTNLLALNAAVEAARAGAHGKGFAVVAEEVRNLAARSAQAARETAELIEGTVKKTENGAQIADRTAAALGEIVSGVTKVSDLVGEIAAASREQAEGIGQVTLGLGQIEQVTQQTTANAEESAAAAEELSSEATKLQQMLERFNVRGGLSPASASLPHPARRGGGSSSWGRGGGSDLRIAVDDMEF